jgi:hypothetical protein
MNRTILALVAASLLVGCGWKAFTEPAAAGIDYALQGEYASESSGVAAQVIALGDGAFRAVFLRGGLPGAGWDGETRIPVDGFREGEVVDFRGAFKATLTSAGLEGTTGRAEAFSLRKVVRESPTLGARPPAGAVILFDGSGTEALAEGELDERGRLGVPVRTKQTFGDASYHLEFMTPFMPTARGQMRGNSGVYLQGRYEVQVLDSFGLSGEDNECGGIYQVSRPQVHMAFPPLQWQSYDIEFRAARFSASGEKTENARLTVRHNGVVIHQDRELPATTGGGDPEGPEPGALLLQDHWNPVVFRNVWAVAN